MKIAKVHYLIIYTEHFLHEIGTLILFFFDIINFYLVAIKYGHTNSLDNQNVCELQYN